MESMPIMPPRSSLAGRISAILIPALAMLTFAHPARSDELPSATITVPAPNATLNPPAALSGGATDDVGVASVELLIKSIATDEFWNGTGFQSDYARVPATLTGPADSPQWSADFDPEVDGRYFLAVFTRDTTGQEGARPVARFTIESGVIDTTAPSVSLDSPEQNATVAAPVTIGGTATDDIGVASVELIVKRIDTGEFWNGSAFQADYARVEAALAGDSAAPSWSYELAGADDGAHFVRVFSRDAAGNDSPGLNGRFTIESGVIDTTAPSVSLDSPEQNATVAAPVTIGGTATDDIAVTSVELIVKRIDTGEF